MLIELRWHNQMQFTLEVWLQSRAYLRFYRFSSIQRSRADITRSNCFFHYWTVLWLKQFIASDFRKFICGRCRCCCCSFSSVNIISRIKCLKWDTLRYMLNTFTYFDNFHLLFISLCRSLVISMQTHFNKWANINHNNRKFRKKFRIIAVVIVIFAVGLFSFCAIDNYMYFRIVGEGLKRLCSWYVVAVVVVAVLFWEILIIFIIYARIVFINIHLYAHPKQSHMTFVVAVRSRYESYSWHDNILRTCHTLSLFL